jgi:hypothetical protein
MSDVRERSLANFSQRIAMELDWWEKAFSGQHSALSEEKLAES